ncbi:MAG: DUF488 domain-containing protein [Candidatus Sumerlaeaceae bacterium]
MSDQPLRIFSVGHSNQTEDQFLALLRAHGVEAIADVRSRPYSKYCPHFSQDPLRALLKHAGIKYVFLGKELGGQPDSDYFYDEKGHALYDRIAALETFQSGIDRLISGATKLRVAMMCSEEDPSMCHRRHLITRVLMDRDIDVFHIRGDQRIEPETEIRKAERAKIVQPSFANVLFDEPEESTWKSIQSGLLKRQRESSSEYFEDLE